MKKLIFAAMALVLSASAFGKDASDLRIYINPGHGSWCSNDRPMSIYCDVNGERKVLNPNTKSSSEAHTPDTLAFYESNTNLRKGFGVLNELVKYGLKYDPTLNQTGDNIYRIGAALDMKNNIVMSHVKCGPYPADPATKEICNRSLSEISAEVENNNFDMFISIHSNAATEGTTTNYPLFIYRGYDDVNTVHDGISVEQMTMSREMSDKCWPYQIANKHFMWTHYTTGTNLRGDVNFYGEGNCSTNGRGQFGYLGAIKHSVPGFLVEGYFHTYQPARHKAMNWEADLAEGYAYARGVADYFGLKKTGKGWIYGVVRDLHEYMSGEYYKPNPATDDRFLPINGCTVTLKKGDQVVETKVTDNYYNGVFVFMDIEPGTYTLEFSHPNYKAIDPQTIEVKADEVAYPAYKLENVDYTPDEVVYYNYPDLYNSPAEGIGSEYNFKQAYTDQEIAELEGKKVRRMVQHGEYLYILALDADNAATLIVYDPAKKEVVANVSTEGMDGTELNCSDIQVTADGYLLACNKELTQYDAGQVQATDKRRGTFWIYKWANDENGLPTGNPEAWISSQMTGNWYRSFAGETFAYSGDMKEGRVVFSCETTGTSHNLRTMFMGVLDGKKTAESFHQPALDGDRANFTVATLTNDYHFTTSPLDDEAYYVFSKGDIPVLLCDFTHTNSAEVIARMNDALPNQLGGEGMFKFNGYSLVVTPEEVDGKVVGVNLTNISKEIDKAQAINVVNGALEGVEANAHATGRTVAVWDEMKENVVDGWMELYLLRDNKLTVYTSEGVDQPVTLAVYAYAPKAELEGENYTISFKATGDAPNAKLVVYTEAGEVHHELGAVVKGENSYTVDQADVPEGENNWAIIVEGAPVVSAGRAFDAQKGMPNNTRGGVKFIDDPNSPAYGKTVLSYGFAKGLEVYDPELNSIGTYWVGDSHFNANNGSSTMRVGTFQGKAYICDWSDSGAGYWIFDPENPEAGPVNYLAGTKNSGGTYTYDGQAIGGGATDIQFYTNYLGQTKMWVFCEDYPAVDSNKLICYDIDPAAEQITTPPAQQFDFWSSRLANINVEIFPTSKGIFLAQTRGEGNDATGCPSFMLIDHTGETELFNSASDEPVLQSSCGGFAVSDDEKYIVVANPTHGLSVFEAEWGVDLQGLPTLDMKFLYHLKNSVSRGYAQEYTQLDFDAAGNLLAYERGCGLQVFALKNDAPKAVVLAPADSKIHGTLTGVEGVAIEAEPAAQAVYYNLQGVRISADNLTTGVYVKVQGNTTSKVLVK